MTDNRNRTGIKRAIYLFQERRKPWRNRPLPWHRTLKANRQEAGVGDADDVLMAAIEAAEDK